MAQNYDTSPPSQAAVDSAAKLYNAVQTRFDRIIPIFESRWTAWQQAYSPTTSSVLASTKTDEYQSLKSLGPKIIAFVVHKLADNVEQHFLGVLLYSELEEKPQFDDLPDCRVSWDDETVNKEILCGLGHYIVTKNLERSSLLERRIADWKRHNEEFSWGSSSTIYTNCNEYFALLELGPSIIAACMVEYVDTGFTGWWWQLIHEVIHGERLKAYMLDRRMLFSQCVTWFNEGEHAQAPKYVQNPWDRAILNKDESELVKQYRLQGKTPPTWAEMIELGVWGDGKKEEEQEERGTGN